MIEVLRVISRFCYLRAADLAAFLKISDQNARRMLNKMVAEKNLLQTERSDKTKVFGLSSRGSRYLKRSISGVNCEGSLTYLRSLGNFEHRCIANEVCIYYADTYEYYTEYEIQTNRAPFRDIYGKIPDALINTDMGLVWVEVENSKRSPKDWGRLINWFLLVFERCNLEKPVIEEEIDLYLLRVEFFCGENFRSNFIKHLADEIGEDRALLLTECYVYFHPREISKTAPAVLWVN